ncbi:hypothetical protein [Fuerstiella marisgermanici]|uniref:Glycosyl hydrolase family 32 N-terminal domain-containing protein n=1 Tax=Fuerstiella marisgermanici TaxID=1891926 RepID=A0A1P8W9I4_9PLAN|nr:hypothetical protein [Fuerstiella marisgermanici]APZ90691.1 hypothetical protein Fuma_00272 [Fuerstiella marisgermanici]
MFPSTAANVASSIVFMFAFSVQIGTAAAQSDASDVQAVDIGSQRELFVEDSLIEQLKGEAKLQLHHPQPQEIALVFDDPWEGTGTSGFHCIFQDGDLYRMYYKAWNIAFDETKKRIRPSPGATCYAESDDGIHWRKPNLGLVEFQGTTENNIVLLDHLMGSMKLNAGYVAATKDANPAAPHDARYKAMFVTSNPKGMLPFKSADGIHWKPMAEAPVITNGAFDSQNVAFWDGVRGEYRAYWRHFSHGDNNTATANPTGIRSIRTATSKDFLHWENEADLTYVDSPEEALYTNVIKPYHRAPHLLIGFPMRYHDRAWSKSTEALPEREHREKRRAINLRYGTAVTDSLVMASRDGVRFKRWNESFLRPGPERPDTWNYGHQALGWHLVETKSALPGAPDELSFYATESYWTGKGSALRRYTLRLDGFVSVEAKAAGGEVITKPLRFRGENLFLNFSTSAAGSVRVEIQSPDGKPLPGFALEDCDPIFGDSVERQAIWNSGSDLASLHGQAVRLRVVLADANLYAFQFRD